MKPGTRGEIIAGPFRSIGYTGGTKVIEDLGDRLRVEIETPERKLSFVLNRDEFQPRRRAKDPTPFIWAEIQEATRRRFGLDLDFSCAAKPACVAGLRGR